MSDDFGSTSLLRPEAIPMSMGDTLRHIGRRTASTGWEHSSSDTVVQAAGAVYPVVAVRTGAVRLGVVRAFVAVVVEVAPAVLAFVLVVVRVPLFVGCVLALFDLLFALFSSPPRSPCPEDLPQSPQNSVYLTPQSPSARTGLALRKCSSN